MAAIVRAERRTSFEKMLSDSQHDEPKLKPILLTPARKAEQQDVKRLKKVFFNLPKENTGWWRFEPLDPKNPFLYRWSMFMLLPLTYEVWAFPYRLALGVPNISSQMQLTAMDFLCDMLFVADMMVTLWTVLPKGPGRERAIATFLGIARHYFHYTFAAQILPCFPFWITTLIVSEHLVEPTNCGHIGINPDALDVTWSCFLGNKDWQMYVWWLSAFVRMLPRLIRVVRDFQKLENNLEMTVRELQVIKFALVIFLFSHWVGCIFYFIARLNDHNSFTWVWKMEVFLPRFKRYSSPIAESYLVCMYKGFTALSDLPYMRHLPNNAGELLFSLFVMVIAIALEGFILGTLLNYMVDKDPAAEAHKRQMEELSQYVESKNLTPELSARLMSHFQFQYQKAVQNRASSSVSLPRSLAIKLSDCKYRGVIDKCTARGEIFYGCDLQFLNALLMKLKVVYYMSSEEVFKKDDLSRELCLVLHGACYLMDDDKVKRVVRDDVPNMAPVLGELAFFLGIVQPMTVRTRPDGDVQLLVLSRDDSNALFDSYPEQNDIICANILQSFGLDRNGQETGQVVGDEDPNWVALKNSIKQAMVRQQYETFATLTFAARAGDVEVVRDLVRRGANINAADYDGRTAFAMACYEGSYKVVELLLEAGVNKDSMNRWKKTPLDEAVAARQGPVIELLTLWKASTNREHEADELHSAASSGDVEQLKRLIESKIDPNVGEHDSRTAMHQAAANGHIKTVEFLVSCRANVNIKDRWGGTPLQDAVSCQHRELASVIRGLGGVMSDDYASASLYDAASRGDVRTLVLLIKHAGVKKNMGDFDMRNALHRAASNARLLAVSYLLGIAADPNLKDRWGQTALDMALRGRSLYHMYCAVLIHSWGGELGALAGSFQGAGLLAEMSRRSIDDVRHLVDKLMEKEYDLREPLRSSEQELLRAREASLTLVGRVHETQGRLGEAMALMQERVAGVLAEVKALETTLVPFLTLVPMKGHNRGIDLAADFAAVFRLLGEAHAQLAEVEGEAVRAGHGDEADHDNFAIDSDEEERLFEELDQLMDAQERAEQFRGNAHKFMANSVQKAFRQILELENAFRLVCVACSGRDDMEVEPRITRHKELQDAIKMLGIPEISKFELETMIEDGIACQKAFAAGEGAGGGGGGAGGAPAEQDDDDGGFSVPVWALIAGSESFRNLILKLHTDPLFCSLLDTSVWDLVGDAQLKRLVAGAREVEHSRAGGGPVYSSRRCGKEWMVLLAGTLRVRVDPGPHADPSAAAADAVTMEVAAGEPFGGFGLFAYPDGGAGMHFTVEVIHPSRYVELQGERIEELMVEDRDAANKVLGALETTWKALQAAREARLAAAQSGPSSSFDRRPSLSDDFYASTSGLQSPKIPFASFSHNHLSPVTSLAGAGGGGGGGSMSEGMPGGGMGRFNTRHSASKRRLRAAQVRIFAEPDLHQVKNAFLLIEGVWRDVAMGSDRIAASVMQSIYNHLGEIGSELFSKLFLHNGISQQISAREFWLQWMKFLSAEAFPSGEHGRADGGGMYDIYDDDAAGGEVVAAGGGGGGGGGKGVGVAGRRKRESLYEQLHSRMVSSRHIKMHLFEDHIVDRYESSYLILAGDLKNPIPRDKLPEFLQVLFPAFPHRISAYNVTELLEVFGRHGGRSQELFWADIRKTLREQRGAASRARALLIQSALNPRAPLVIAWGQLIQALALYHFLVVPIRVCFVPWPTMTAVEALCTDLIADILTAAHVVVLANTAYMSSRAVWVTRRAKLIRRIPVGFIMAAVPVDWIGYACGASNPLCCWLRLGKLALPYTVWTSEGNAASKEEATAQERLQNLAAVVFSVVHIGACIWFYIGNQEKFWNPGKSISWYYVDKASEHESFTVHNKFGMQPGATVWEQYLLSFYWIAATMTSNGLVFDVVPQNLGEIGFAIVVMIFNLTLFRYVMGEVSTIVMKADERIIEDRAKLEAVESLLRDERIPDALRDEIRSHFHLSQSNRSIDQASLFSHMSHSLKVEVASSTAREYLDNVALFQGCGEKLLDSISVLLTEVTFAPEEYLYRAGEVAHDMFFVASGSVDELTEKDKGGVEKVESTITQGMGTGELSFFFGLRHLVGARANRSTGAVCLKLPRAQLLLLLKLFPADEEKIAQAALTSFDRRPARSKKSGSVAQRSVRSSKSGRSRASSRSRKTAQDNSINSNGEDSEDTEDRMEKMEGDEMHDRIEALKVRRRNDRINMILYAAAKGDLHALKDALKTEGVNVCDGMKRTPLHVAASEGKLEVVKFLVEAGADVNAEDAFKNTSLNDAVRHKHDTVAKLLCEHGANLVLEEYQAGVLMCQAAYANNVAEVRRLIDNRVSPSAADYDGRSGLHLGSSEGHYGVVELLLDSMADITARDRFGGSGLEDAVRHGHVTVQRLLRERGGALDVTSSALKMCQYAARGDLDAIKVLVENGVDCSIGTDELRTGIHLAASNGMISILDFLFKQKQFQPNLVDKMGGTPLEDAKRHGMSVAMVLLEQQGGVLAKDKSLEDLKKEQATKLEKDQAARRKPLVVKLVEESPEVRGCQLVEETFIPGLRAAFDEVHAAARGVREAVAAAGPFMRLVLSRYGLPGAAGWVNPPPGRPGHVSMNEAQKAVDLVMTRMSAFAAAASACIECFENDFPRKGALEISSKLLHTKAGPVRRVLKECLHVVRKAKKPLQELRSLSRPRGNRRRSSAAGATAAAAAAAAAAAKKSGLVVMLGASGKLSPASPQPRSAAGTPTPTPAAAGRSDSQGHLEPDGPAPVGAVLSDDPDDSDSEDLSARELHAADGGGDAANGHAAAAAAANGDGAADAAVGPVRMSPALVVSTNLNSAGEAGLAWGSPSPSPALGAPARTVS